MNGFAADLTIAGRRLRATPAFTLFAVISLAAGIAITTAAYSVVRDLFFDDPAASDPSTIAFVTRSPDAALPLGSASEPDVRDLREAQTSFERLAASLPLAPAVTGRSRTEVVSAEAVDGSYFPTLGVRAVLGRTLDARDDAMQAHVVVLSDQLWRDRFGADRTSLGAEIRVAGQPFTVVGIAEPRFRGVGGALFRRTKVWIPLGTARLIQPTVVSRDRRDLIVFGRLKPSVTPERASAELAAVGARLDRAFPASATAQARDAGARGWRAKTMTSFAEEDTPLRRIGLTLIGLVALVLIVACTNLANLTLARGTTRRREFAVRRALGASRWRLVREQLAESAIVAVLGSAAAYGVFQVLRVVLRADFVIALPQPLGSWTLAVRPALTPPALVLSGVSVLLSIVVFGLEPAWRLTRSLDLRGALEAGGGSPGTRARQRMLLRWQVAVAAAFFIVATMFVKYTMAEARHDPGVALDGLAVATLDADAKGWDRDRFVRALDRVVEQASADSAIGSVTIATGLPFGTGYNMRTTVWSPDRLDDRVPASALGASPSIFRTLDISVVRGRPFDDRDDAGAPPVVVISEFTGKRLFGDRDPIGQRLSVEDRRGGALATIVGIAADTDVGQMEFDRRALLYRPLAQQAESPLTIAVRSSAGSETAAAALRDAVRRADPDLPVAASGTARELLSGPWQLLRAGGLSALALGVITLLLAMAGLYGIQSHAIARRTKEIGVRMSLGATDGDIKMMVLRDGYRPVVEGLVLGLAAGLAGRVIVRATIEATVALVDPWMLAIAPLPLILAAFFACYLPARRAAAVEPSAALRDE